MDRETILRQRLSYIDRRAKQQAKPIIDELIKLECVKPLKPMVIDAKTLQPLDTSELGPVKVEPDKDAIRAKIVRDALRAIADIDKANSEEWFTLAYHSSDEVLAKLGRMLK